MAAPTPVYTPPIPYLGPIPGGLSPGKMITVDGYVPPHAQRFAINIQCGPGVNPRDDMSLHLNFRFPEMCVVRNHLQGITWGPEETGGGMPLTLGNTFQAIILCEQHAFKIALNGAHFCEFPHRLPYQRGSHMTIDGDVTVTLIQFQGGSVGYQQPPNSWGTPSAPPMGAPGMGMPAVPPPYGPPPPYNDQSAYAPPPAAFSYAPQPNPGYQTFPQQGGYQPPYPPQIPTHINTGSALISTPPYTGAPVQHYQSKKEMKKKNKAAKKALKYGIPIVGVGLGAYAVGRVLSRSSSSSSSD